MRFGTFFFGTVDMPDAGQAGPPAHRRRYTQADYQQVYRDLLVYAQASEALGFVSMWTAEHHFQHHGFEVVPNVVLLNAVLAQHTQRLRFGSLVHVLTSWHPVRFAEDFAMADVLSGGRLLCGLGRGTEPRESAPFGVNVGWNNDPDDVRNREVFEEQVAIFKAATSQEQFQFRGQHYVFPPDGLEFRGEAVSSDDTLEYVARQRHIGVFWQLAPQRFAATWHRYAELVHAYHGVTLEPGEDRMLVVNMLIGDSTESAIEAARPGHDELRKLIWPNIVNKNPALAGRPPFSLEESMAQGAWLVGTAEQVRDQLLGWHADLSFDQLVIFPHFPGMTQRDTLDQLERFHRDVMPALVGAERSSLPAVAGR